MPDDIKINAADWQSLSGPDKDKLNRVLKEAGLLRNAAIKPDPAVPAVGGAMPKIHPAFLGISFCKIACDVGEAAAVAGCTAFTGPVAGICVVAAHAAAEVCRNQC